MIFVSHKETDTELAKALVECLHASLDLRSTKIRCTSVPGSQLPFGETISSQLKKDINSSKAIFVLITRESLQSRWVLFELGAAWSLGKVMVPILGPGLSQSDLPGPLKEYPVVIGDHTNAAARFRDSIAQVAQELSLNETGGGEPQSKLEFFIRLLQESNPGSERTDEFPKSKSAEGTWIDVVRMPDGSDFFGLVNITPDAGGLRFSVENTDRNGEHLGSLSAEQIKFDWPRVVFMAEGSTPKPKYSEGIVAVLFEERSGGPPLRFTAKCLDFKQPLPDAIEGWRIEDPDKLQQLSDPLQRQDALRQIIRCTFPPTVQEEDRK